MIRKVSNIMVRDFTVVDVLNGVRFIKELALKKDIDNFLVAENNEIVGIITKKQLIAAHPNRIAADVMLNNFVCVSIDTSIWKVKEIFNKNDIDISLVKNGENIEGFITEEILNVELGKHIDLLTGLYKSDYIFYKAIELVENNREMSLIFIDVNKFGYINKEYGHVCGDMILKDIADLLKEFTAPDLHVCRFGGDEFIVLTPYYIDKSEIKAREILKAVNEYEFVNRIPVTISAGIAGKTDFMNKDTDINSVILKLVNTASLASTKAKKDKKGLFVVCDENIDQIA
ncbi:GGDEF domain-containing protein [Caminicella sporogenes]|uniref:GGDEF domain-containing protein n=1 Tax=Caminicella sporogenes TaxID=166485 RepID=UPI0025419810|nr:GGDEF domain-containing protein [Caminicella sporogenes]WIF95414.1 GGDEF domain-containing protein [Caminicella sporogenes]